MKYLVIVSMFLCSARNLRLQYFSAEDASVEVAKTKALKLCQESSAFGCFVTGCSQLERKQK